ncbi:RpiB/LacA/LacB family sugar-phosphate isomerase [Candidatus Saccharibacteria bacterium]|nr:RpiB/LacA/LacB family sugar-phosphate isomerase [Candidatus Saccharibacteria bacterium]
MEVFVGADHRGYEVKNRLVSSLSAKYQITDLGPEQLDPDDDYNDIAIKVVKAVLAHPGSFGILICGSAHGVAIQANRFNGIRAISAYDEKLAQIGREHNDANVLCLSADFLDDNKIDSIANIFLNTNFSGEERHKRRIAKLDQMADEI